MSEKETISMIIYSIYKVVNNINGKVYIGFDSNWPSRKKSHYQNYKSNKLNFILYKSMRKYGWENFTFELIYQSKNREHTLNIMEPFFIEQYSSFKNGYNMTRGGEGTFGKTQSEKTKKEQSKLISERNKKSNWYNNGVENKFCSTFPGNGWKKGRINQKPTTKDYKWYTNGIEHKLTNNPPKNWEPGMSKLVVRSIKTGFKKGHIPWCAGLKIENNHSKKKIKTPDGIFDCIKDACKYYNISPSTMSYRLKKFPEKYYTIKN
jgi:group I intron endonuclease